MNTALLLLSSAWMAGGDPVPVAPIHPAPARPAVVASAPPGAGCASCGVAQPVPHGIHQGVGCGCGMTCECCEEEEGLFKRLCNRLFGDDDECCDPCATTCCDPCAVPCCEEEKPGLFKRLFGGRDECCDTCAPVCGGYGHATILHGAPGAHPMAPGMIPPHGQTVPGQPLPGQALPGQPGYGQPIQGQPHTPYAPIPGGTTPQKIPVEKIPAPEGGSDTSPKAPATGDGNASTRYTPIPHFTPVAAPKVGGRNPFDFARRYADRAGHEADYSRLTGTLSFVHTDGGHWVVRYASPMEEDRYGGSVVLSPDADLGGYREGDMVAMKGAIMSETTSARMLAPTYRVKEMRLVNRP